MTRTETDYLEQIVHFITELLDKVHVRELVQHQILRDGGEGNLHTGRTVRFITMSIMEQLQGGGSGSNCRY